MAGWNTLGNHPEAYYTKTWAGRNGDHLSHWKNSAYSVYTYQTATNLPNGTYILSAWFSSSGGQSSSQFSAKSFGGGPDKYVNILYTGTYSWTQLTISNINVTNGQVEIGFWSQANVGNWLYVDDISLTKN